MVVRGVEFSLWLSGGGTQSVVVRGVELSLWLSGRNRF